ncbi:SecY subunit domain-containing protein [Lactarius quietus]|nr:SecY subunit domain-containing protein [Lactarius quietus]
MWPLRLQRAGRPSRKHPRSHSRPRYTTPHYAGFRASCSTSPISTTWNTASDSSDPFYWMCVILASNRGTFIELSINLIVTSGMRIQLLAGANIIDVDFSLKEDRGLFAGAQKRQYIRIYVNRTCCLYGLRSGLGAGVCLLHIIQLVTAALIVIVPWIILGELLQNGHSLSSGISYIATNLNICESFAWKAFTPLPSTPQLSHVHIVSQMLFFRFPGNIFVEILGVWEPMEESAQLVVTSGFAYSISPPRTLHAALVDHLAQVTARHREPEGSMYKELKRVIPTAATLEGAVLGLLSVAADLIGAIGSGTGIMAATIIYSCMHFHFPSSVYLLMPPRLFCRLRNWTAGGWRSRNGCTG